MKRVGRLGVLALVFVLAGCGAVGNAVAAQPASGREAVLDQARAELAAMRLTRYQHETDVDPLHGRFYYDCSGFVDYALTQARPAAEQALPIDPGAGRPLAQDYEHYLRQVAAGTPSTTWEALPTVRSLLPGDVVAWLITPDSRSRDTGHVMIVLDPPVPEPARRGAWLVHVADSTTAQHADDSRLGTEGLGTGTIGLQVDDAGRPVGFYWRGGVPGAPKLTDIALGRPL